MNNDGEEARVRSHGSQMGAETTMDGSEYQLVHCCACWKYTDDISRERQIFNDAVSVLINGNTLCVENSEAWKAADAMLTARFKALTALKMPAF